VKCSSVPQSTKNKYVVDTGFGLTVDILCGSGGTGGTAPATADGQGNSKLKQDAAAIDCGDGSTPCKIVDAAVCCYDPRFDQRSDGTHAGASVDLVTYADPGVQEVTAFRGALSDRAISEGGRAHSNQLVAECDVTGARAPSTIAAAVGDVPLQGGSATYWWQMIDAKNRLGVTSCP
jgi:hypothetical protein